MSIEGQKPPATTASSDHQPLTPSPVQAVTPSQGSAVPGKRDHRRHSLRSIKRRKFDDEIVESSLASKGIRKSLDGSTPTEENQDGSQLPGSSSVSPLSASKFSISHGESAKLSNSSKAGSSISMSATYDRKSSLDKKVKRKKLKKTRQAFAAVKDMGRWKPTDDILLIDAVERLCDLSSVHLAVKFSCRFTLEEVQERWYALLYDPVISTLARQAMKTLPREWIKATHAKALFTTEEEQILCKISSNSVPTLEHFQSLLDANQTVFHPERTPNSLLRHWSLLQQYHLLNDQVVQPLPKGDQVLNFSDAEDLLDDDALSGQKDVVLANELNLADRRQKREIKQLEQENERWKVLTASVATIPLSSQFDEQTLAVLQGRLVRYLMRSREITLGRCTDDVTVDVDLSLEGPASKVSRRQGTIKMKKSGEFVLSNDGKRPFVVDGKAVVSGSRCKLVNNSVLELGFLRFVFIVNKEKVSSTLEGKGVKK